MALDGESIVNEDLVAWVSMGIQHIPRSEVDSLSMICSLHKTNGAFQCRLINKGVGGPIISTPGIYPLTEYDH